MGLAGRQRHNLQELIDRFVTEVLLTKSSRRFRLWEAPEIVEADSRGCPPR